MATPTKHDITTDQGTIPGLLWLPGRDEAGPGLVVVQEIFGLSDYMVQRCQDLADLGYTVLAPQLFARLDPPREQVADTQDVSGMLQEGMALTQELNWDRAVSDVVAALQELRGLDDVDAVGLVGFCYGGGVAFNATAQATAQGTPPDALVSFYGSALPTLLSLSGQVQVPSFHTFGTADSFIPVEQVERIRDAVTEDGTRADVVFELHEGAGHAFDNPHPAFHHEKASRAAWEQATAFLNRVLPA